jgi:hypothetical protein
MHGNKINSMRIELKNSLSSLSTTSNNEQIQQLRAEIEVMLTEYHNNIKTSIDELNTANVKSKKEIINTNIRNITEFTQDINSLQGIISNENAMKVKMVSLETQIIEISKRVEIIYKKITDCEDRYNQLEKNIQIPSMSPKNIQSPKHTMPELQLDNSNNIRRQSIMPNSVGTIKNTLDIGMRIEKSKRK